MAPTTALPVTISLKNGDQVKINGASFSMQSRVRIQADFSQTTFTALPAGRFATGPLIR
jgi:hypothetical protein